MVSIYELTLFDIVFYAKVEKFEEYNEIIIHIGTRQNPNCMFFILEEGNDTAVLQNLDYYPQCTSDKPMPKMVKTAFAFIFKKFKWIKKIILTDNSKFECENYSVATSNMSFLINKKTWYEKHFNAQPNFEGYELLKHAISQKPTIPFGKFWNRYFIDESKPQMYAENFDFYNKMYNESGTYYAFFRELHKKENCKPFIAFCNEKDIFRLFNIKNLTSLYGETWIINYTDDPVILKKLKKNDLPKVKWGGAARKKLSYPKPFFSESIVN